MSSKRRRHEVREFWRMERIYVSMTKLCGGVHYERMPGRGLAVRKEFNPLHVVLSAQLNVMNKVIEARFTALNAALRIYVPEAAKFLNERTKILMDAAQLAGAATISATIKNNLDLALSKAQEEEERLLTKE